ncbi:MAG: hypothetical protein KAS87_05160, partial [Candidatus Omnitrophica bacterium]|nr:hypothetical protein [Candidatus Omnitrophota bacterium]
SGVGSNHQYDYSSGFPNDSDTVYKVSGGGAGEFPEDACAWVKGDICPDGYSENYDPGSGQKQTTKSELLGGIRMDRHNHPQFCCHDCSLITPDECCESMFGITDTVSHTGNWENEACCTALCRTIYNCYKNRTYTYCCKD